MLTASLHRRLRPEHRIDRAAQRLVLLARLVEDAWRAGRGLSLEELIPLVGEPPFAKMGALPIGLTMGKSPA